MILSFLLTMFTVPLKLKCVNVASIPEEGPAAQAAGRPVVEEVPLVVASADGARRRERRR